MVGSFPENAPPPCRAAIPSCSPREILWDRIAPRIRRTDVVLPHRVPRKVRKKQVPYEIESPRHVSLGHSNAKARRTATAFCGRSKGLLGNLSSASVPFMTLKARVCAGRLVVDEPTDLRGGTEVELLPLDPGDWLDEADRAALHAALRDSDADVAAGRLVDAAAILKELRSS